MTNLTFKITEDEIKKIFGNRDQKLEYLHLLSPKNVDLKNVRGSAIDKLIIDTWNYEVSKTIIRKIFMNSDKFILGEKSKDEYNEVKRYANSIGLSDYTWPFSAQNFDDYIWSQIKKNDLSDTINNSMEAVKKYVIMKKLGQTKNDYIEYLIVKNNENIIPTLKHRRDVDFYINGLPFDQKTSKSVGSAFIKKYGESYKTVAYSNPELVAKSLYENQDAERFGSNNRLLVVYLNNEVSTNDIDEKFSNLDFSTPISITFNYKGVDKVERSYTTNSFVIII